MKISLLCQHFYVNNKLQPKPTFIDIIALFFFSNYREQFANEDKNHIKNEQNAKCLLLFLRTQGTIFIYTKIQA